MVKSKHIPFAVVLSLLAVFISAYLILADKTADRFTGTQGSEIKRIVQRNADVLEENKRAISDKTADRFTGKQGLALSRGLENMHKAQEEAWARIECRQIVFILSDKKYTKSFEKELEACEGEGGV